MLQNSLQNNRQMLMTTTTVTTNTTTSNTVTTGTTGSSSTVTGRNGRVRQKRGFGYEEHRLTPGSIPTHPNRQIEDFLRRKDDSRFHLQLPDPPQRRSETPAVRKSYRNGIASHNKPTLRVNSVLHNATSTNFLHKIKRVSLGCIQLAGCNVGRMLYTEMGPGTGLLMRMLR
jgi:hypothetical protein